MKIGNTVRTQYGDKGRIVATFNGFSSVPQNIINEKGEWLEKQIIPIKSEQLEEEWYYIRVVHGGSLILPDSALTLTPNRKVNNATR